MKILRFLTSKIFITVVLIIIQVIWILLFWIMLSDYLPFAGTILTILSITMVVYIISHDSNPSYRLGWVIFIMALPLLGGVLYLFYGNKRPTKKLNKKIQDQIQRNKEYMQPNYYDESDILENGDNISYLQHYCGYPVWENTETKYYPVGEAMYEDMLETLEKAESFIFMEYFIIEGGKMWNGIYDILKRKAKQGVDIRVMYDDIGSINTIPKGFIKELNEHNIECVSFNKLTPIASLAVNNRDHRKILVIDGHTAFTGGINIADEYINQNNRFGHWKDTGIKVVGDAVWNFTVMFLELWSVTTDTMEDIEKYKVSNCLDESIDSNGFVLPFGDSPLDDESVGQSVYLDIINQARQYVYIFTPYLIIDDEMQSALKFAAKRGVDVRIITPGVPDKKIIYQITRSYYQGLILSGVSIYEYTPGFLHAKSFVSDDKVAVVGTINLDYRSLYLHFECGTYLYNTSSVLDLKKDFLDTITKSRRADSEATNIVNSIIRVFAPLL